MSRYTLLLLLNLPLIIMAVTAIITRYKMNHASRRRTVVQLLLWVLIFTGLLLAQPLYEWLLAGGYTDADSLSLFDVIQITAIVILLYALTKLHTKVDVLEQRLGSLHREASIVLSGKRNSN